jgi:hypothetical protein
MDYYENHQNARCHHSPLINIPLTESSTFLVYMKVTLTVDRCGTKC